MTSPCTSDPKRAIFWAWLHKCFVYNDEDVLSYETCRMFVVPRPHTCQNFKANLISHVMAPLNQWLHSNKTRNQMLWLHLVRDKTWINTHEDIICHYIYIYAFSRRIYPKRLTVQSGYTFLFCLFTLWHQKVRTLCNLLQKCHYAA